jgi:hypothetical protein
MVGIDLTNGAGLPEVTRFQEYFHDYKIVFNGLICDSIGLKDRSSHPNDCICCMIGH